MAQKKFNFTKAGIERLPVGDKRVFFYDVSTRGLAILVEPTGRKTFYLYRKSGRTTKQLKLGVFPDLSIELARAEAHKLNVALVNKEEISTVIGRKRGEMTFGALFDWWLETHAKHRRKTWAQDKAMYDLYLSSLGQISVSAVTKAELRRLHGALGRERGHRTANRVLEMVRAVFNQAIKQEIYKNNNPVFGVEMFERNSRERRLMPNEVQAFFSAVQKYPSTLIRDYILISLFTGQRQANVLAMRWEQIDWHNGLWRIPVTKNGRPMVVPLEEVEMELLKERKGQVAGSPWVFPSPRQSKAGHLMEPKKAWASILKEAGIADFHIHDLRRSLGSMMADTGASLLVIGRTLGHQSHAATQVYARLSLDPVREAKSRALKALLELPNERPSQST